MSLRIAARTDFEVLEENADWMMVGKPAPLMMHPTGASDEVTLLGVLKKAMPGEEFFFVNRLDRETSGCVLVAKSGKVARKLGKMMARREIEKGYEAIARGWPDWDEVTITGGLRRKGEFTESAIWVRQAVHAEGKESETEFSVKRRFENERGKFCVMDCRPKTGRTHQIRVHLEFAGFPMVGDKIYGGDEEAYLDFLRDGWTPALQERLILDRQALHASWMKFMWDGEVVMVRSAIAGEMVGFCIACKVGNG